MHYESGVGHIGGNLSALDTILVLFHQVLMKEDDFVLSKGHAAGALYIALWSLGRLSDNELRSFHKDNTFLPGHPPFNKFEEISFSTGSLGHGFPLAAGIALANRIKNERGHVFCLTSDGEWEEGSNWETLLFASHHNLFNLTVLIDANGLQGFGTTGEVASLEPLTKKLKGFEIDLFETNGHNADDLRDIIIQSSSRMRIIILRTIKGHGISFMENKMHWHYLPLTEKQYSLALKEVEAS